MFESGVELRGGGQASTDAVLLATVADSSRVENRAAARKVLAAGALWDAWIERDVELGSGKITDCGNAAIAELAVRLGCSKTVAESFAALGIDLRLRLPRTRAAFEAGDLDLARARAISRETTGLSAATVTALEPQVLAAARHLSPGPLASEIERLVAAHSPDETAEQREAVQRFSRRVVKRSGRGGATVEMTVTPQEGEAFMQLVAEFAGTVCRHDRRGAQEKLVDSVMALAHREPYLECTCGRDDCDAPRADALPGRRAPLTQITVDLPTMLGLLSEPAYLHGHGLIDPILARQLAANGTWQAMLTEILDLAEELGLVEHGERDDAGGGEHHNPTTDEDHSPASAGPPSPSGQSMTRDTPATPPPRFCVRSFLARGSRRTAGPVPDRGGTPVEPPPPPMVPTSVGTMAESILDAVRANPALAWGTLRDGHSGLVVPPTGALTYRPDAATAALVRARDRHCRFPGCTRPAAQCQLDHIVEYLAWNPVAGGWTIVSNLQCLCAFHHQLKTLGFWRVVPLGDPANTGHALLWTSTLGSTAVTLPGGATGAADLTGPRPRINGRRDGLRVPVSTPIDDAPPF